MAAEAQDGDQGLRPRPWRPAAGEVSGYLAAAALIAGANLIGQAGGAQLAGANLAMLFLLGVLVSALGFGLGPALFAAFVAAISYNFFFLEPRLTFEITHPADVLTFMVFFAVALVTGWLAGRVRDQARSTARRARTVGLLLEASRRLSAAASPDATAQVLAEQASLAAGAGAVVLLPEGCSMRMAAGPPGLSDLAVRTRQAARHIWETGETSGMDGADWTLRPLAGLHGRVGVIGFRGVGKSSDPEREGLLVALLHQGAVALERASLASAAAENEALRRADDLRSALLNSISHDFRTPLSTVLGSSTTLLEYEESLTPSVRRDLLQSIAEEARRLNRYVGDLLDMSRLEGGALKPRREPTDVRAVLTATLSRLREQVGDRRIVHEFASQMSLVNADPTLLGQAVLNILENAVAYSPDHSSIELAVQEDLDHVLISIEDQGPGIPTHALDSIFDRFRRLETPTDRAQGLGLGLSIAKGFVEAMGGRIAATSPVLEGRGTRFLISLPKAHRTPRDLL